IVCYALGLGKPVVASDHPAFQGKPVLKFRTVEELVALVEKLRNPEFRARWETYSRKYGEMFSWSRVAWLHHHLYMYVLRGCMYSLIQLNGVKDAYWQLTEIDKYGSIEAERDPIHKPRQRWVRGRMKHPCVDVGCLFGYMGCGVNVDIAWYRVKLGKLLYPEREFIVADAHKLPFRSRGFRQTLLCEVLEHVENPLAVLREASRVAEEVVITVPDEHPPYMPSYSTEHVRFFTKESLMKLIGEAGLKPVEYRHVVNRKLKYAWFCLVGRGS
ncbi:MAG: hypothetical protein DRO09_03555, partial [Thermoprotei archaeon]